MYKNILHIHTHTHQLQFESRKSTLKLSFYSLFVICCQIWLEMHTHRVAHIYTYLRTCAMQQQQRGQSEISMQMTKSLQPAVATATASVYLYAQ